MTASKPYRRLPALILTALLLGACASHVPETIRTAPDREISIRAVQHAPQRYLGDQVRWGGDIITIENRADETWVEVLARPLGYAGEPDSSANSSGRFLARFSDFLDPAIYTPERKITVRGRLERTLVRPIGEHPYRFPLVQVETHHLWPKPPEGDALWNDPWYLYPYGYDPFYGPYPPYYWEPYFSRPRYLPRH